MTTPAAEQLYLAQHLVAVENNRTMVFNPHAKPLDELPVIYGLNNGGSPGWYTAGALAEDGTPLWQHVCSNEGYMPYDLGIIEGKERPHVEAYSKHYPDGYRMEFVPTQQIDGHNGLQLAIKAANNKHKDEIKDAQT
jgi:hypothetical protein